MVKSAPKGPASELLPWDQAFNPRASGRGRDGGHLRLCPGPCLMTWPVGLLCYCPHPSSFPVAWEPTLPS